MISIYKNQELLLRICQIVLSYIQLSYPFHFHYTLSQQLYPTLSPCWLYSCKWYPYTQSSFDSQNEHDAKEVLLGCTYNGDIMGWITVLDFFFLSYNHFATRATTAIIYTMHLACHYKSGLDDKDSPSHCANHP